VGRPARAAAPAAPARRLSRPADASRSATSARSWWRRDEGPRPLRYRRELQRP
jgi:hypothetical protein